MNVCVCVCVCVSSHLCVVDCICVTVLQCLFGMSGVFCMLAACVNLDIPIKCPT